jgi:hypothetical protein
MTEQIAWRWFDAQVWHGADTTDEECNRISTAYWEHVRKDSLAWPVALRRFAVEPHYYLHDARIQLAALDPDERTIDLTVEVSRQDLGARRLVLHFRDAVVVPPNIRALEMAITAEFHREGGSTFTDIIDEEIDTAAANRFVLRLRLWPFHEFTIEFGAFEFDEEPLTGPVFRGPGRFVWQPWETSQD